jgi:hypothetical protein
MTSSSPSDDAARGLRALLLAIVALGLVGTAVELVLLEHYEDSWQLVPLVLIGVALLALLVHLGSRGGASVIGLRFAMSFLIVSGLAGMVLHYRGSMEFQLEMDPTQGGWALFAKVIRAKAPPTLAPGVMAQLGLIGLLYTYRHPALGVGIFSRSRSEK